jgi:hypothetical protein
VRHVDGHTQRDGTDHDTSHDPVAVHLVSSFPLVGTYESSVPRGSDTGRSPWSSTFLHTSQPLARGTSRLALIQPPSILERVFGWPFHWRKGTEDERPG